MKRREGERERRTREGRATRRRAKTGRDSKWAPPRVRTRGRAGRRDDDAPLGTPPRAGTAGCPAAWTCPRGGGRSPSPPLADAI
eukprot:31545-Pelagococcus_subviridis.AAC.10